MRFTLLAAAVAALLSGPSTATVPVVGQTANGNIFQLANGQQLSVDKLKGMVVVVTYWAEDCRACNDQIRILDYFRGGLPNVGLVTLAASADSNAKRSLREATRGTGVHGVDAIKGWIEPMAAVPTTYVIDRKGTVRYAGTGVMTVGQLNAVLVPILREPQPAM